MKDVCFGPKNLGLSDSEIEQRAIEAIRLVGLPEEIYDMSPFELSGGQKRRVAIAGVLAMEPDYLILDEPTAGLDPIGRDSILDQVKKLHEEKGIAVILVSHSMEDVAKYVERMIVIDDGRIRFDDIPRKVFMHYEELEKMGLSAPAVTYMMHDLRQAGLSIPEDIITVQEARDAILKALGERR